MTKAAILFFLAMLPNAIAMGQARVARSTIASGAGANGTVGQSVIGTSSRHDLKSGLWYGLKPAHLDLQITSTCSDNPDMRTWVLINPNPDPVLTSWKINGSQLDGTFIAPSGESFLNTIEVAGDNVVTFSWLRTKTKSKSITIAASTKLCFAGCANASSVVSFMQGRRKDNRVIASNRSNPTQALGEADANDSETGFKFVSLGFGGSLVVKLDHPLMNASGPDLRITETSTNNPNFYDYPEQAEIFVSKDGTSFTSLGKTNPASANHCNTKIDTDFDLDGIVEWCLYVKILDITNPLAKKKNATTCVDGSLAAFNSAADGFDVDAVTCISSDNQSETTARIAMPDVHSNSSEEILESSVAFPNPATNSVTIDLNDIEEFVLPEDGKVRLQTWSAIGTQINESTNIINEDFTTTLSLNGFPRGMLIVRIINAGQVKAIRILKE